MRSVKPRVPCRKCAASIDQDWTRCPACSVEDPHRTRRHIQRLGVAVALLCLAMVMALTLSDLL